MSIIQQQDLVTYQLRTKYLDHIKDGVGERLITINDTFLNTPGFKAAGWRPNPAHIQRTHSPDIPTGIASEYFRTPAAAGLLNLDDDDEVEEGGMVTGGGAGGTLGPGINVKRRRRREQMEEDDSSDLSDESDEDEGRAAQQIKFAKMPVRTRASSSPMRNPEQQPQGNMTSPTRQRGVRRGSQSTVELIKERARRDTVTSSEMSSENEFDNSAFRRERAAQIAKMNAVGEEDEMFRIQRQESELLQEEMEDSDGSDMSEAFAHSMDSQSMIDSVVGGAMAANVSPGGPVQSRKPQTSPRKARAPAVLPDLPAPRPVSFLPPPRSLLTMALTKKRGGGNKPFERFAPFSGVGDPNPFRIRIMVPWSKTPDQTVEVLIRRFVSNADIGASDATAGQQHQVTVADLIGLSLWRCNEEKVEPEIGEGQRNVNRWVLRMVDDDEVDYDFPPLDRTKPVDSFATANKSAGRSRNPSKSFDVFALVQATEAQFAESCQLTPEFKDEDEYMEESLPPTPAARNEPPENPMVPMRNPLLTTISARTPLDAPALPQKDGSDTRLGEKVLLRIHIHSLDAAPGQMVTLDVTTGTYLAEVLDMVCKKRNLEKATHVLKLPHRGPSTINNTGGQVVMLDKTVGSLGGRGELELWRRRFATDGLGGLPGSPSSTSPRTPFGHASGSSFDVPPSTGGFGKRIKKSAHHGLGIHPLAQTSFSSGMLAGMKQDELTAGNYKRWVVYRKQPMRFVGVTERVVAIEGDYLHISPPAVGATKESGLGHGKEATIHFSNVIGCKVMRRHPTHFKVMVFRATETKRYDFEAKSADEAAEIVFHIKKGIAPYHDV